MFDWCFLVLGITGVVLIVYFLVELHYFLRTLLCVIVARFFKKKKHILDVTEVTGVCMSNDIDYLLDHMNNARYLRELDFAKVDFYERTGLYNKLIAKGGSLYAGASTIRYRRFIKVFSKYRISTKIIYWDNQNIYIEHKFMTGDNFVNAIALCRIRLVKIDAEELMKDLMSNLPKNVADVAPERKEKPLIPPDLEKWIESNRISSDKLRENNKIDNRVEISKV
ncbi:protein THEM6-like [Anthonomus grandis grandis]|uniref:protein THEM6-like n=1 Tax=Anthonomus grandis grandis TaxID=2921223 RepID=UPI002166BE4A|nr:protein THEM6-like [Anthonomus grandis grandis]